MFYFLDDRVLFFGRVSILTDVGTWGTENNRPFETCLVRLPCVSGHDTLSSVPETTVGVSGHGQTRNERYLFPNQIF